MGSFSWTRADKTTNRKNLTDGDVYKILIPKEFGGGFIVDTYYDYGYVFEYDENKETADLYGILAYWNKCEDMIFDGDKYPATMDDILQRGKTCLQENRKKGIHIGCYNEDIDKLKYPLKLVSLSFEGTYEECDMRSYSDDDQGFYPTFWDKEEHTNWDENKEDDSTGKKVLKDILSEITSLEIKTSQTEPEKAINELKNIFKDHVLDEIPEKNITENTLIGYAAALSILKEYLENTLLAVEN